MLMQELEKKHPGLPVPALGMVLADPLSEKPDADYKFVSGRVTFGLDAGPLEREAVRRAYLTCGETTRIKVRGGGHNRGRHG